MAELRGSIENIERARLPSHEEIGPVSGYERSALYGSRQPLALRAGSTASVRAVGQKYRIAYRAQRQSQR